MRMSVNGAALHPVTRVHLQETDNPDLRDRAYVYWRLLSTDPEAAKDVILADKPIISDTASTIDPAMLDTLLANISSLASVYHKPPDTFVSRTRLAVQRAEDLIAQRTSIDGDAGSISPHQANLCITKNPAVCSCDAGYTNAGLMQQRPVSLHGRSRVP